MKGDAKRSRSSRTCQNKGMLRKAPTMGSGCFGKGEGADGGDPEVLGLPALGYKQHQGDEAETDEQNSVEPAEGVFADDGEPSIANQCVVVADPEVGGIVACVLAIAPLGGRDVNAKSDNEGPGFNHSLGNARNDARSGSVGLEWIHLA